MREARTPFTQIYRINALRAFGGLAACLIAVTAAPPPPPVVQLLIEVLGTMAILIAIAGRGWSLFYIGGRKNAELVTTGPYSISRNPLYFFSLVGIAGVGAQTGSLVSMALITLAAYLAFDMAMRGEEAYLGSRYGQAFDDFKRTTPRLWPDLSLWRECEDLPLRSDRAIRSLRDAIVFLAAWISVEFIRLGQAGGFLPILIALPF